MICVIVGDDDPRDPLGIQAVPSETLKDLIRSRAEAGID
jgi:hypothetical protein